MRAHVTCRFLVAALSMAIQMAEAASQLRYVVQAGDTFSEIAANKLYRPIYPTEGSLEKLLALNPHIKNPHFILPGQIIIISQGKVVAEANKCEIPQNLISATEQNPNFATTRSPAEAENIPVATVQESVAPPQLSQSRSVGYGIISLTPDYYATKISAIDKLNGSKATLLTRSNIGLRASYAQVWNDRFKSEIFFNYRKISLREPSSGGTLSNSKPTLNSFGAATDFSLTKSLSIRTTIANESIPFLRGVSATEVTVDPLSVITFSSAAVYEVFAADPFTLGVSAGAGIAAPADSGRFKSSWNHSFEGSVFVNQQVNNWLSLDAGIRGAQTKQETTVVDQTQTDYGIFLKLLLPFGKGGSQ